MKKQLSHFAYNERSRSGWTLSIPPFTSLSPLRSTIKNCYLCPRHVCYPCLRSAQGEKGGGFCGLCSLRPLFASSIPRSSQRFVERAGSTPTYFRFRCPERLS